MEGHACGYVLLVCVAALRGAHGAAQALPYTSLVDYGLESLSAATYVNDSSLGISASLGALRCLSCSANKHVSYAQHMLYPGQPARTGNCSALLL